MASYTDEGVSGALPLSERPQGRKLLRSQAEVLIFWSMDRFTRSAARGLADLEALEAAGKTVVFVKEAIDTSTPSGRLFRTMLAAFAEFERETIMERNMGGRYSTAKRGGWASGSPPFGYVWANQRKRLEPVEPEASTVRRAYDLRLAGHSFYAIADILNDEGHSNRSAVPFVGNHVNRWVSSTLYRGDPYVVHLSPARSATPERFEYEVVPLIDPEDWLAAQKTRKTPRTRKYSYALLGRVHHADCADLYAFTHSRNGARYYRCSASRNGGGCPGFGDSPWGRRTALRADKLETATLGWLQDLHEAAEAPQWLGTLRDPQTLHQEPQDDPLDLREQLSALGAKRDRWLELYAEGLITRGDRNARLYALGDEEANLEARLRATMPTSEPPPAHWADIAELRPPTPGGDLDPPTIAALATIAETLDLHITVHETPQGPDITIQAQALQ